MTSHTRRPPCLHGNEFTVRLTRRILGLERVDERRRIVGPGVVGIQTSTPSIGICDAAAHASTCKASSLPTRPRRSVKGMRKQTAGDLSRHGGSSSRRRQQWHIARTRTILKARPANVDYLAVAVSTTTDWPVVGLTYRIAGFPVALLIAGICWPPCIASSICCGVQPQAPFDSQSSGRL